MYPDNSELINALRDALQDEENAIKGYAELAEKTNSVDYRRIILGIRRDEQIHALRLRKYLLYLSGVFYSGDINIRNGESKDFKTGLREAIKDEEEAAISYKKIMDMSMHYPELYFALADNRKDEQLHAMLLKTML